MNTIRFSRLASLAMLLFALAACSSEPAKRSVTERNGNKVYIALNSPKDEAEKQQQIALVKTVAEHYKDQAITVDVLDDRGLFTAYAGRANDPDLGNNVSQDLEFAGAPSNEAATSAVYKVRDELKQFGQTSFNAFLWLPSMAEGYELPAPLEAEISSDQKTNPENRSICLIGKNERSLEPFVKAFGGITQHISVREPYPNSFRSCIG